ncbi:MAG: type II toxin-antitoxin system HicB family antitoxin [Leptospiraceae bacterium]|nr:type II toxin-antitoxin system HicB family antitoxin [Leptospiraceae bacterium]
MKYSVVIEKISDDTLPEGYYYAFIPALDLTTQGLGIDGAKAAAKDLLELWIAEKKANGEKVPEESESFFSQLEVAHAV